MNREEFEKLFDNQKECVLINQNLSWFNKKILSMSS